MSPVPLVAPALSLAGWTLIMEIWMYAYRIPDLEKYKVDTSPNMTAESMKKIPRHRQWPADNYNHLHEQPTVFYATAICLTLLDAHDKTTVGLAWAYVAARVLHSLIQARTNVIMQRFSVFAISGVILGSLVVRGLLRAFWG
ncbi:unnamed protein product [Zymoseptoria tritici ST99CH_3D1]|nr:unnamed protein product [Zymoseptoria tritici ST99CH_3D1]